MIDALIAGKLHGQQHGRAPADYMDDGEPLDF